MIGRFIIADPAICHGQPTFRGTRILVALAGSSRNAHCLEAGQVVVGQHYAVTIILRLAQHLRNERFSST
jgi:hypothetical protein